MRGLVLKRAVLVALVAILSGGASSVQASPVVLPPGLWVSAANGDDPDRLVRHTDFALQVPEWSPDSTRIAYLGPWLSIIDVSSRERQQLTQDNDYEPDWSPDGRDIAFTRYGKQGGVFVVDAITGMETKLVGDVASRPQWSPDGELIGYIAGDNVYTVRPDGTDVTNLSRLPPTIAYPQFSWAPDSTKVAFSRSKLFVIDVATKQRTRLKPEVGGTAGVEWSPDGSKILFDNFHHVYTIRPDGSGLKRITVGRDAAWSPDGSQIAFLR